MYAVLICFLLLTILLTFCATQMKTTLLLVSQKYWVGVRMGVGMPLPLLNFGFYLLHVRWESSVAAFVAYWN
jgi:hypothetical protein